MIKQLYKYFWLAPIFIFIQVYVLNQVLFNGYINPYFYIMLIICLPQITPRWLLLFFAFFLGFFLDIFEGSIGFHSTACVFIAFIKPSIERLIIPKNTISEEQDLFLQRLGSKMFSVFSLILIFTHHTILFLLAHFKLTKFSEILGKICLSSLITFTIIIICQFFFFKTEKR
mgnify:CR=1 FL=1|jgi:rod shape-determining protein MreD|tara:strand:+ start:67 stop:582 length:516 start_codon:yes stop_codon:yes gene_type:complete